MARVLVIAALCAAVAAAMTAGDVDAPTLHDKLRRWSPLAGDTASIDLQNALFGGGGADDNAAVAKAVKNLEKAVAGSHPAERTATPLTKAARPTKSAIRVWKGDHGVVSTTVTMPGVIDNVWWLDTELLMVLCHGNLWATRDGGRSWKSWTEGEPRLQSKTKKDWGAIVKIVLPSDGLPLHATVPPTTKQRMNKRFVVVCATNSFLFSAARNQVGIVHELLTADDKPVVFDFMWFHPTKFATRAMALLTDDCESLDGRLCPRSLYFSDGAVQSFAKVDIDNVLSVMYANPIAPAHLNFTQPKWARKADPVAKAYDANEVFVITMKRAARGHKSPAVLHRLPLAVDADGAATAQVDLMSVVNTNTIGMAMIGGFEFSGGDAAPNKARYEPFLRVSHDNFASSNVAAFPKHVFKHGSGDDAEVVDEDGAERAYAVVGVREDFIVNVYRGSQAIQQLWGHTYMSGVHGLHYTLSLPYTRRTNHWGLTGSGVDLHRAAGLDGVIVANVVTNPELKSCRQCRAAAQCEAHCTFATVLSTDNGKTWQRVKPPHACAAGSGSAADAASSASSSSGSFAASDSFGKTDERATLCSLNLHGYSSGSAVHPLVSSEYAPGLILANGNVGDSLHADGRRDDTDVYMTRDAGLSWKKIADGPHAYGETDFGSLIYMCALGRLVSTMRFSLDSGKTWQVTTIAHMGHGTTGRHEYRVLEVMRPRDRPDARYVVVFAETASGKSVVLHVDFSAALKKQCTHADLEQWSPVSYYDKTQTSNAACLLGRHVVYTRQRYGHRCWETPVRKAWVAADIPLHARSSPCRCTDDDYECDLDYHETTNGACAYDNATAGARVAVYRAACDAMIKDGTPDPHYVKLSGFRRIAGDGCTPGDGGTSRLPASTACSTLYAVDNGPDLKNEEGSATGAIVFFVVVVLLVVGVVVAYPRVPAVRNAVDLVREKVGAAAASFTGAGAGASGGAARRSAANNATGNTNDDDGDDSPERGGLTAGGDEDEEDETTV
jgi:photosystem II stability/assembly factor-like uncharacterized protein